MLDKLTIKGYKSIRNLENFKLENINILIGANGVGKSNFISIFKILNSLFIKNLQLYTQSKGPDNFLYFGRKKTQELYLEFVFSRNHYCVTLIPTDENKLMIKNEYIGFDGNYTNYKEPIGSNLLESNISNSKEVASSRSVAQYTLDELKKLKIYHFHDTSDTARMKRICAENDNLMLKSDAQNIAPYLKKIYNNYPDHYKQILRTIQDVAPFFGGFVFRDTEYIQLEWYDKNDPDTPFKAHILSDGTLRFICLATLLLQPFELMPNTIIIDEPELGLHPYALKILSEIIKRVSQKKQLIISSQSVELINHFEANNIIVVDREDNQSTFTRLDNEKLKSWLEEYTLGEIWASNLIGGKPK
ncbi:chromosome segregation protein SMC [Campylobacter sp. MIT 99-7217]|uniref:AAA family ATPase n=1 Tax=Campylobacter sp. MIT 99-7217 TaxID=535091 RepID=UPI00115822A1|nr:AAA family ATPase [Campylobacter sp. MIT 99-7217]TQR33125.1 chromosome segregation protein SMC [Campylobacter sp. MIT 99-7217]